jgi:hypothetical protein
VLIGFAFSIDRFNPIKWTGTEALRQYKRLSVVAFIEGTLVKMGNYFFIVATLGLFLSACSATITSTQENLIVQNEDKGRNTAVSGTKKQYRPSKLAFASPEGGFGATGDNNLRTPDYWTAVPDKYRGLYYYC